MTFFSLFITTAFHRPRHYLIYIPTNRFTDVCYFVAAEKDIQPALLVLYAS